jgi:hypothetical protein
VPEWRPGVLEGLLAEIETVGQANLRAGLLKIAASVEAAAKADLALTTHPYGTPSPAPKGGPPSLVTGTGRRSIGHQFVREGIETVVKIGTLANVYPPAQVSTVGGRSRQARGSGGDKGKTPSSKYLLYQETHSQFDHPFLKPAFLRVVSTEGVAVWMTAFRVWPRLP